MRIQHNIAAMNSYRNYNINTGALSKNLEKLSSGYKINRAGDDAAGLAISEKMRAQISGLKQASSNVKDGISLVKTAEGALQEVQDMLNRMVTLSTQSANGTYDNKVDRANLQKEVESLKSEIDRIADSSNFNGTKLLDGSLAASVDVEIGVASQDDDEVLVSTMDFTGKTTEDLIGTSFAVNGQKFAFVAEEPAEAEAGVEYIVLDDPDFTDEDIADEVATVIDGAGIEGIGEAAAHGTATTLVEIFGEDNQTISITQGLMLQIGDTADSYNQISVAVQDMHVKALGLEDLDISTQDGAAKAVEKIKDAINSVSSTRGDLGAIQNRLEHTTNNLAVMTENIQDAESTIRDTDIADEMTTYTKNNILLQSAQAMLAQANQMPQGVLQLLQ